MHKLQRSDARRQKVFESKHNQHVTFLSLYDAEFEKRRCKLVDRIRDLGFHSDRNGEKKGKQEFQQIIVLGSQVHRHRVLHSNGGEAVRSGMMPP